MRRGDDLRQYPLRMDPDTDAALKYIREAQTPLSTSSMDMCSENAVICAAIRLVARILRKDKGRAGWLDRVDDRTTIPVNIGGINATYCSDEQLMDELWGRLCPDMGPEAWRIYIRKGGTVDRVLDNK